MRRKEVNLQSPLRILDRSIRGGLGKGRLGVILAPAGMGKSACLVQIGLDDLLREKPVLHVAIGQSVEHVAAWYDAAFDELAGRLDLADRGGVREAISQRRLIWAVAEGAFSAHGFRDALFAFKSHLAVEPSVVLLDGFDWEADDRAVMLQILKETVAGVGAELWMTSRDVPRREPGRPAGAGSLVGASAALVDVALLLEPHGRYVQITVVNARERLPPVEIPIVLQGGTLRALREDEACAALLPEDVTLLATGCAGAEEEFGACAERWGVEEVNFTFPGRQEIARTRGLVELGEDELRLGEVSAAYVKAHLHRTFPETAAFGHVLQTIWHQVSTAGELFVVGSVNADKTAHGGTGWAVELARHWGKPVHLFDQERSRWLRWDEADWIEEPPPLITRVRFAGTGTRSPSEHGRAAIRALFERSFGAGIH